MAMRSALTSMFLFVSLVFIQEASCLLKVATSRSELKAPNQELAELESQPSVDRPDANKSSSRSIRKAPPAVPYASLLLKSKRSPPSSAGTSRDDDDEEGEDIEIEDASVPVFYISAFGAAGQGFLLGGLFGGIPGCMMGSIGGFVAGGLGAYLYQHFQPHYDGVEVIEPFTQKVQQLAYTVLAIATAQLDETKNTVAAARIKKDIAEVKGILQHINNGLRNGDMATQDDFHELEEIFSHEGYATYVTAEAALENEESVTAHDIALITSEGGKLVIGEDQGPAGELEAFEGDMVPENISQLELFQKRARWGQTTKGEYAGEVWTGGIVNFCFAYDVPVSIQHIFHAATVDITTALPCLRFQNVGWASGSSRDSGSVQRCQVSPAIFVQSHPNQGCYSFVGMTHYPSQKLQLHDPYCATIGTAIHELGHALGMAHENSRPDRDLYITVNWNNIENGYQHNFEINQKEPTTFAYSYNSVMHYDAFAYALNSQMPTLYDRGTGALLTNKVGQRVGLMSADITQLQNMYSSEVEGGCQRLTIAGQLGCINKPALDGSNYCAGVTQCSALSVLKCCGCGGGVKVQCYVGRPCPNPPALRPPEVADCLQDESAMFGGNQGCYFSNKCSFPVSWKCSLGCEHTTKPGGIFKAKCGAQPEMEICSAAHTCSVWRL